MIHISKMNKAIFNGPMHSNRFLTKVKLISEKKTKPFFYRILFCLGDKQGLHVRSNFQLAVRALGGIIW